MANRRECVCLLMWWCSSSVTKVVGSYNSHRVLKVLLDAPLHVLPSRMGWCNFCSDLFFFFFWLEPLTLLQQTSHGMASVPPYHAAPPPSEQQPPWPLPSGYGGGYPEHFHGPPPPPYPYPSGPIPDFHHPGQHPFHPEFAYQGAPTHPEFPHQGSPMLPYQPGATSFVTPHDGPGVLQAAHEVPRGAEGGPVDPVAAAMAPRGDLEAL